MPAAPPPPAGWNAGTNTDLWAFPEEDPVDGYEWEYHTTHWTRTRRSGWMRVSASWLQVPVYESWSERPHAIDGVTPIIRLILDHKLEEALAMLTDDVTLALALCKSPSPMEGNNLLHLLAHRGGREWGTTAFKD